MNLKVYLATIDMSLKDFASLIDCSPVYLGRLIKGKRGFAGKRLAADIERLTDGMVKMPVKEKKQEKQHQNEQ